MESRGLNNMENLQLNHDLGTVQEELYAARKHWYDIGVQLQIPVDTLDSIKVENTNGGECLREVLKNWLKRVDPHPTWRDVVIALSSRTVGECKLAEELKSKYCSCDQTVLMSSKCESETQKFNKGSDCTLILHEDDLQFLLEIVDKASHCWKTIGLKLGFLKSDLEELQGMPLLVVEGPKGFLRELLGRWLNWAPPNHNSPSGSDLVATLREVGEEKLAHDLQRKLQQIKGATIHSNIKGTSVDYNDSTPDSKDSYTAALVKCSKPVFGCGCGGCSFETFIHDRNCPKPVSTQSGLPYLDTKGLTDDQRDLLIGKLLDESRKIMFSFQRLVSHTIESLEERGITPEKVVMHLMTLQALDPVHMLEDIPQVFTFHELLEKMIDSRTVGRALFAIRDFFSFFNYDIIEFIIEKSGSDSDQMELRKYERELEIYCKRRVYEAPPTYGPSRESKDCSVVVKKEDKQKFTLNALQLFRTKLATILHIKRHTLRLVTVREGCIELTFQIPKFAEEIVFPLPEKQKIPLKMEGIKRLTCGNYYIALEPPSSVPQPYDSLQQAASILSNEEGEDELELEYHEETEEIEKYHPTGTSKMIQQKRKKDVSSSRLRLRRIGQFISGSEKRDQSADLSEEIIKTVETNGEGLTDLLRVSSDHLNPDCLTRALLAAVRNDNHLNISKLIVKGATNIDEALALSMDAGKPHARAMLLLVKAAMTGDQNLILQLFGDISSHYDSDTSEFQDEGFQAVQEVVQSGKVSTVVPIEIARQNHHPTVREELLLKTDVDKEEGSVYWHGLRLLQLDISWLRRIHWVERLRLAWNGLRVLPHDMGLYLKQVMKLDLQHNELSAVPHCILELPALQDLNLSHNKLTEIPEVPDQEWSPKLTVLDLSYNHLSSLPLKVKSHFICFLNIGNNQFQQVPISVCSLFTLHSLDLSNNPGIQSLPVEMGNLSVLTQLNLRGLKNLNFPPKNVQKECRDCISYLHSKLRNDKNFFRIKMMILGRASKGKTTLVCRLQGKDCTPNIHGLNVSEWSYRPNRLRKTFYFNIWDFSGQEEYYFTHQCFLSQRSIYLLLFNLKDGEKGVQELKPWLTNIAVHARRSMVIIIGTHLDEFSDEERGEVNVLIHKLGHLIQGFKHRLQVKAIVTVGLMHRLENIGHLKKAIYKHAANYQSRPGQSNIMGRKVPASYLALVSHINVMQQEVRNGHREPIMHAEEFKTLIQQMNLTDLCTEKEVKMATQFLADIGTLLHYDDKGHNLRDVYFIDPCWLYNAIYKVISAKEIDSFVKDGILPCKAIPQLFKDDPFPWQFFEQYLTLLDRFEIALPLDNKRILIPSMLPKERPSAVDIEESQRQESPLYFRHIIFQSADTPPGFWSRLLSRLMHSVPQVCFTLEKTNSQNPDNPSEPSLGSPSPVDPLDNSINPATSLEDMQVEISQPTMLSNFTQPPIHTTQLLNNFRDPIPALGIEHKFDSSQIQLISWRTGLFYSDPEVMFRIECLSAYGHSYNDGVLIVTSPTGLGKKIMCQLVDLVLSLISEWYPGIQEGVGPLTGLEQKVPCYECLRLGRTDPFLYRIKDCVDLIENNQPPTIMCGYDYANPARNHSVSLIDMVPDLLFQDIEQQFHLKIEDLNFSKEPVSVLGVGTFGKVYRGKYCSEGQKIPVAIKLYNNTLMYDELHHEASLLQKSHHPSIVCLVGICIHSMMALVLEEAPMRSLQPYLIKDKIPIHRLVIHRMAAQVAAALHFLHSTGIIFRDLKAANVLLWSLSPDSLCHCKLTDFGTATHLAPVGAKGLQGTKGFIAPEVFYIDKRNQRHTYDHRADIYSFSMFLYQMIARRHPFHDMKPHRIDKAVELGERPKLQDVSQAETAFHYLTRLMKCCWEDNIDKRPSTEDIIKILSHSSVQTIMCVLPVRNLFTIRDACTVAMNPFTCTLPRNNESELWVCYDGPEGTDVIIYDINLMADIHKYSTKGSRVKCIGLCGDHVWMGINTADGLSILQIFKIHPRAVVHSIQMNEYAISCITCTNSDVYIGTMEGYCLCYTKNVKHIDSCRPKCMDVSEHAIDGILAVNGMVWISHTNCIDFLDTSTWKIDREAMLHSEQALVGKLSLSADSNTVWSAHFGCSILSAWNSQKRENNFNIDVGRHLKNISSANPEHLMFITAMTPALDTVWVGAATGHILIFHAENLITWYHFYNDYITCLCCIPSSGPTKTESSMIVSGGKKFSFPVPSTSNLKDYDPADEPAVLVLWEAYDAKTIRQIKLVEDKAPDVFKSHSSMKEMIQLGGFEDGTNLFQHWDTKDSVNPIESRLPISSRTEPVQVQGTNSSYNSDIGTFRHTWTGRAINLSDSEPDSPTIPDLPIEPLYTCTTELPHETFDIQLLGSEDATTVRVSCQKPVMLKDLLSELQVNISLPEEQCMVEYLQKDSKCVTIHTQKQFEAYLRLENKPQLFLAIQ